MLHWESIKLVCVCVCVCVYPSQLPLHCQLIYFPVSIPTPVSLPTFSKLTSKPETLLAKFHEKMTKREGHVSKKVIVWASLETAKRQ